MAAAFNLTAQINLRGPSNLKPVVANIKRQLGSINADVKVNLDSRSAKSIEIVTNRLKSMNTVLVQTRNNAQDLNTAFRNLSASLSTIQSANSATSSSIGKVSSNLQKAGKDVKIARTEMEEFGKQSYLAIKRFAAFSFVTTGIFALTNAISSGVKAFIDFDRELVKLQQVTGKGAIGISSLEKTITNLATSLGVSSESLIKVASTLAQAGFSAEETRIALTALAKTELAPSFDDLPSTTEGAIAALRQFGLEAKDLEAALGSINAVAAAFAVESSDIITAIQRTGGVFAAASKGVSEGTQALNEFVAVFTSIRATTRESAETIATGLRTIFTRIQRAKTIDQLKQFGVNLQDLEGKFVGPYEAVKRLSEALNKLDPRDVRFSTIVEELGGFRQIGKVIPLIQQFATTQAALGVAQKGQNSLTDAQIKAQQSLANQIAKVREQFLALIRDIGKSNTFQALFKIVTGLASGLISLASAFKPILPILAIFGAIKGFSAITQFTSGFFGSMKKGGGTKAAGENIGSSITGNKERERAEATSRAADAIRSNTDALRSLTSSVQSLESTIKSSRGAGKLFNGGKVLGFSSGGSVPGSGKGDKVPARLEPGEFVMSRKGVANVGRNNLEKLNRGGWISKDERYEFSHLDAGPEMSFEHRGRRRSARGLSNLGIMLPRSVNQLLAGNDKKREFISKTDFLRIIGEQTPEELFSSLLQQKIPVSSPSVRAGAGTFRGGTKSVAFIELQKYANQLKDAVYTASSNNLPSEIRRDNDLRNAGLAQAIYGAASPVLASGLADIRETQYPLDPDELQKKPGHRVTGTHRPRVGGKSSIKFARSNIDGIDYESMKAGGIIQRFMAGGMTEDIIPKSRSKLFSVLPLDEAAKAAGIDRNQAYDVMGLRRSPNSQEAAWIEAIQKEYIKKTNRLRGAAQGQTTRLENQNLTFAAAGLFGQAFSPENLTINSDKLTRSRKVRVVSGVMDAGIASELESIFTQGVEEIIGRAASSVKRMSGEDPATNANVSSPFDINAEATIQGPLLEKVIRRLGGPGAVKGQGFDFPSGLQGAAKYFGLPSDIPTDVKRTLSGPSTITDNIVTYLKNVMGYKDGGIAQRKIGYIDYDVIANDANKDIVEQGMKAAGVTGPRLYSDYLTDLAVKARKNSSIEKLRAIYGVAGSGKTTLARGQGTDNATLRQTERFPILSPEDIQKASEILVLSSSVSKKKLDEVFGQTDRTYTLSSTTASERATVKAQKLSRDISGIGLENRQPGSTSGVSTDSAVGEALLADSLGDKSVVLGRSSSGKLRRKKDNELVQIIKKKIGFTWGGFAPMTAGHESIMDAAAAMGYSPEDFLYLVGANEGIKFGDASSYRTAVFDQDARVLLARAGAGSRGATVLPKPRDFEVPSAFDISDPNSDRRKVLIPAAGSRAFVADKTPEQTKKYKEAGYSVTNLERTGGISGTMVRDLIMAGNMSRLQDVLSPNIYDLVSNNIKRIQNRAKVLPDIIEQVKSTQEIKLADVDAQIKALGISRIDNKKIANDPEYAAKVEVLQQLRNQRDKIKNAASFEPYKILEALATKDPENYALDFSNTAPSAKPIRTVSSQTQKAFFGGIIQRLAQGGVASLGNRRKALPSVNQVGAEMADELGLVKGKNAWNQSTNNCLEIAVSLAKRFGYEADASKIRSELELFQQIRLGKNSPIGIKPTEELLKKSPKLRRLTNDPASRSSEANVIIREGEELMKHVSLEVLGKEYNYGVAGTDWPIILRVPVKKNVASTDAAMKTFAAGGKAIADYYSLEKGSGLNSKEFNDIAYYAKTNSFSLEEFKKYLAQRIQQKKAKSGLMMNPASLLRAITPETPTSSQKQKDLASSLMGPVDAKYNPKYDNARFASGGTVSAMVSNGETFVPPAVAKKIGYSKLNRMNNADRNGTQNFASGGISVFKGPGSGTSDSIGPVNLPVGSFIIRQKATKALGLYKNGGGVGIQKFEDGGMLSKEERKRRKEQYAAQQRGGLDREEARSAGIVREDFGGSQVDVLADIKKSARERITKAAETGAVLPVNMGEEKTIAGPGGTLVKQKGRTVTTDEAKALTEKKAAGSTEVSTTSRKKDITATSDSKQLDAMYKKIEQEVADNYKKLYAEEKKKIEEFYAKKQAEIDEQMDSGTLSVSDAFDQSVALSQEKDMITQNAKTRLTQEAKEALPRAVEEFKVGKQTTKVNERKDDQTKDSSRELQGAIKQISTTVTAKYQKLLDEEAASIKKFYQARVKQVQDEGGDIGPVQEEYKKALLDAKQSMEAASASEIKTQTEALPAQLKEQKMAKVEADREAKARAADPFYDAKKAADTNTPSSGPMVNPKIAAEEQKYMKMRAERAGLSVGGYKYSLAQKLGQNKFNVEREMTLAREETKTAATGRKRELAGVNIKEAVKEGNTSEEAKRVQGIISEFTSKLQQADPTLGYEEARQAAINLAEGLSDGTKTVEEITQANETLNKTLNQSVDAQKVNEEALRRTSVETGESKENLRANISQKQIDQQAFIQSREGQRFGKLAEFAPGGLSKFSKTKAGAMLGSASDFVSGKGGKFSQAFASMGGTTGVGMKMAVGAEAVKSLLPKSMTSDPNTAGIIGAVGGAGTGMAAGGELGGAIAGDAGRVVGAIGGAIIGGIQGFFNAKNQALLTNAIEGVAKSSGNLDVAFKKLEKEFNESNFKNVQKEFGNVVKSQQGLNQMAFGSSMTGENAVNVGGTALAGAATGAALGAIVGSIVPVIGTAIGAAVGGAIGGIGAGAYAISNIQGNRKEALGAIISQSGANQQTAQRLAEGKVKTASSEDLSKQSTAKSNVIVDQYVQGAMESSKNLSKSQQKLNVERAKEQAALDGYIQKRKQAGATDDQITKELEKNMKSALAEGRKYNADQAELIRKQGLLARASKELAVASESLLDVYRRASAYAQRFSDELGDMMNILSSRNNSLSGQASNDNVSRVNERVLGNMSAYSTDEVKAATNSVVSKLGNTPEAQQLGQQAQAAKFVQDKLPAMLRNMPEGGDRAEVLDRLKQEMSSTMVGVDLESGPFKQMFKEIENKLASDAETGTLADEISTSGLGEFSKVAEAASKTLQTLAKTYNDALQQSTELQKQYNESIMKANEYTRKAGSIRINAELDLAKALGKSPTLAQLNEPVDFEIKDLTKGLTPGGTTDPAAIAAGIMQKEKQKTQLEADKKKFVETNGMGSESLAGYQELDAAIGENVVAINEGRQALERLASDGTKAANALSKIEEQQRQVEGLGNTFEKIFTSGPEELFKMQTNNAALQKAQEGTPGFMKSLRNRQMAFAGLEQAKEVLKPEEYRKQRAQLIKQSFTDQGKKGTDVVDYAGVTMTLDELTKRLAEGPGADDPNVIAYQEAVKTQIQANEKLAMLEEAKSLNIQEAMLDLQSFLATEFPKILAKAVTDSKTDASTKPETSNKPKTEAEAKKQERAKDKAKIEDEQKKLVEENKQLDKEDRTDLKERKRLQATVDSLWAAPAAKATAKAKIKEIDERRAVRDDRMDENEFKMSENANKIASIDQADQAQQAANTEAKTKAEADNKEKASKTQARIETQKQELQAQRANLNRRQSEAAAAQQEQTAQTAEQKQTQTTSATEPTYGSTKSTTGAAPSVDPAIEEGRLANIAKAKKKVEMLRRQMINVRYNGGSGEKTAAMLSEAEQGLSNLEGKNLPQTIPAPAAPGTPQASAEARRQAVSFARGETTIASATPIVTSGPVPVTKPQTVSAPPTTTTPTADGETKTATASVTIDPKSLEALSTFNSDFNTHVSNFGKYVTELTTFTFPTIPDKIELNHTVKVDMTGAASIQALEQHLQELAMKLVQPKIDELRNQTSSATKGAVPPAR